MMKELLLFQFFIIWILSASAQVNVGLRGSTLTYQSDMIEFAGKEHTALLPGISGTVEKKLSDWFSVQGGIGINRRNMKVTNKIVPGIVDPLFNRASSNLDFSVGPKLIFPMQRAGLFAEGSFVYGVAFYDKTKYGFVDQNNMPGYPLKLVENYQREEINKPGKPSGEIAISMKIGVEYSFKKFTFCAGASFFRGLTEIRETNSATGPNKHNGKGFFVGVSREIHLN
jgi:hypothetical protein